jgi:hypothetical protein
MILIQIITVTFLSLFTTKVYFLSTYVFIDTYSKLVCMFILTKSSSLTVNLIGFPFLSTTFVPTGAFSSAKPSVADAEITGGLLSTGFTVMNNLAVADLFCSLTSSAYEM